MLPPENTLGRKQGRRCLSRNTERQRGPLKRLGMASMLDECGRQLAAFIYLQLIMSPFPMMWEARPGASEPTISIQPCRDWPWPRPPASRTPKRSFEPPLWGAESSPWPPIWLLGPRWARRARPNPKSKRTRTQNHGHLHARRLILLLGSMLRTIRACLRSRSHPFAKSSTNQRPPKP